MTLAEWLDVNAALLPHQVAGVALLCVAIWLLLCHARAASTRHFAGFLLGYGLAIVLSSIELDSSRTETVLRASASVAFFYCTIALLMCVLSFPRPAFAGVASTKATLLPAGVSVIAAAGFMIGGDPAEAYSYAAGIGNALIACSVAVAFTRLAREPPGEARRSLLLLVVGVSLQEMYFTTLGVTLVTIGWSPYPHEALIWWGNAAAILIVFSGALPVIRQAASTGRGLARTARLALVGLPLGAATGILSAFYARNEWVANLGSLWRLVFVGLVAWGILRHQFLGVDLRVRWAIGRSTVAAAFIAVFFVASEGAQILFGAENEWVGLLAAGGLVFAIAPLQRAAERLAERAVPIEGRSAPGGHGGPTPEGLLGSDLRERNIYAFAVRAALCDGPVTRAKEEHLAHVAVELGIPHPEAVRILRMIEEGREVA